MMIKIFGGGGEKKHPREPPNIRSCSHGIERKENRKK